MPDIQDRAAKRLQEMIKRVEAARIDDGKT